MNSKKTAAPALDRGLTILEYLQASGKAVTVAHLSKVLKIPLASTNRIVQLLKDRNYLLKTADTYSINEAIFLIPSIGIRNQLKQIVPPFVEQIARASKNTTIFLCWRSDRWECIANSTAEYSIAMQPEGEIRLDIWNYPWSIYLIGDPSLQNSWNHLEEDHKRKWMDQKSKMTASFNESKFLFENFFRHVRRVTYPLFNKEQKFVGAFGVGGPTALLDDSMVENLSPLLKMLTKEIQSQLVEL